MNPADVRGAADLLSVLAELGVEHERKGDDLWFRCRSGEHPDRNPSATIRNEPGSEKHGFVFCHSCKWSTDVFGLVQAVKGYSFPEALNFVGRHRAENMIDGEEDPSIYGKLFRRAGPDEIEFPDGLMNIRPKHSCFRYLQGRGFGWTEVERFWLMDWRERGRLFVPIFRNGKMISYVARSYRNAVPKVLTPLGASGARWALFNVDGLDRSSGEVHLTEGWASCIRVWQAGFTNAVATCGSRLKQEQVMDLAWVEKIVFWQEGDHAGESFFGEVLGWLGRGRSLEVVRLDPGTDPADHDSRALRDFYNQRTIWSAWRRNGEEEERQWVQEGIQPQGRPAVCQASRD